jgi:hypothetical protein
MPPKNIMHFTKANVETKAIVIVESFIVESSCELPPPMVEVTL